VQHLARAQTLSGFTCDPPFLFGDTTLQIRDAHFPASQFNSLRL